MSILNRTSEAYIWMFNWPEAVTARRHLRRAAGRELSKRLIFTDLLPLDQRITGKTVADLFLDTPEYNAHGTATEVLSAGVPVLTLPGPKAHSSRVAASVVLALEMPELVARTRDEYENIAVQMIQNPKITARIRQKLETSRNARPGPPPGRCLSLDNYLFQTVNFSAKMPSGVKSTLFDKKWWASVLERSFFQIWELWCAGESPRHTVTARL